MRWLLALLVVVVPRVAEPCSISPEPGATVFGSGQDGSPGLQPWIATWRSKPATVKVTAVKASCRRGKLCKGKPVTLDRAGRYLRPAAPLPAGTRIQVTYGKKVLADVTLRAAAAKPAVPTWDGVTLISAQQEPEGMCSPAGPAVKLKVKPTKAVLEGTVALVYFAKPDPAKPLAGLKAIQSLGHSNDELTLDNDLGEPPWMTAVPSEVWVVLGDSEGQLGAAHKVL